MGARHLLTRLRAFFRGQGLRDEIRDEFEFHIEQRTLENVRRGLSPEDARRSAERAFGRRTQLMQAAYDYTLAYLTGQIAGAPALQSAVSSKGHAVAEMLFTLEAARALYYRAISEVQVDPPLAAVQRARAAHVTIQRSVVVLTQEAIRVCGGRAMLKRYPLERYARDARAAALMRPWTQDIATQQAWEFALGIENAMPQAGG